MTELRDLLYRIRELHAIKPSRSSALAAARNQAVGGDIEGATEAVDAVELEMLPAVAAGGGGGGEGPGDNYFFGASGAIAGPLAPSSFTSVALGSVGYDPEGWLGAEPYASLDYLGETLSASTYLTLPRGVFSAYGSLSALTVDDDATSGFAEFMLLAGDNRLADASFDPWNVFEGQGAVAHVPWQFCITPDAPYMPFLGIFRVRNDTEPFVFAFYVNNSLDVALQPIVGSFRLIRITDNGGDPEG